MVQMELAMKKKERNDKVYEKGIIKGRKHCYCFLTRRYLRFIFPPTRFRGVLSKRSGGQLRLFRGELSSEECRPLVNLTRD